MDVRIEQSWKTRLEAEFEKPYFEKLTRFVREAYHTDTVFPPGHLIFNAFEHCPFEQTKVVILGQDPYHDVGQAHGLCFSVPDGVSFPPSLVNIFKELYTDLGKETPRNGELTRWAKQGVLLLNATLTVSAHHAGSHQNLGWEQFTDAVIHKLNEEREGIVYILWGAYAQRKGAFVDTDKNLVLKSPHPSPLSSYRGFFGSRPFSKTNAYLRSMGKAEIDW